MPLDDLKNDERGLALGIVVFISMIVIAALLFLVLNEAFVEVVGFASDQTTSQGAQDQIDQANTIWARILLVPLFLAMIFIIARAVREGAV